MTLYVIRHGVAEERSPAGDDAGRRLTAEGRTKMRAVARGLRALGARFDVLLTSPLPRAAETAKIVSEAYGNRPAPREFPGLAPGVGAAETARLLRAVGRASRVAIVGHEPGLSSLASLLLSGSPDGVPIRLKKGGVIVLEVAGFGPRRGATLRAVLPPRALRRLGRRARS
jgi:phosphohistidine phosphatase